MLNSRPDPAPRLLHTSKSAWSSCRSEEHTSELQPRSDLVCRLLLAKKNKAYDEKICIARSIRLARDHGRNSVSVLVHTPDAAAVARQPAQRGIRFTQSLGQYKTAKP